MGLKLYLEWVKTIDFILIIPGMGQNNWFYFN
jgi:hypothetical protein